MKQNILPNGVWIKSSEPEYPYGTKKVAAAGWHTTIWYDLLIINDGHIRALLLHMNKVIDLYLIDSKLILNRNQENYNINFIIENNGLIRLIDHQHSCLYFKTHKSVNSISLEKFREEITGKWYVDESRDDHFIFENTIDPETLKNLPQGMGHVIFEYLINNETEEKLIIYHHEGLEKFYIWTAFEINGIVLLEINMLLNGGRRLYVIKEMDPFKVVGYYIDENGLEKEIMYNR